MYERNKAFIINAVLARFPIINGAGECFSLPNLLALCEGTVEQEEGAENNQALGLDKCTIRM